MCSRTIRNYVWWESIRAAPNEMSTTSLGTSTSIQDRILYGTDLDFLPDASPGEVVKDWQSSYARDWNFLATSKTLCFRGTRLQGLNLPQAVFKKIFCDNAIHWIPGLAEIPVASNSRCEIPVFQGCPKATGRRWGSCLWWCADRFCETPSR
jgi:hypothetical protein